MGNLKHGIYRTRDCNRSSCSEGPKSLLSQISGDVRNALMPWQWLSLFPALKMSKITTRKRHMTVEIFQIQAVVPLISPLVHWQRMGLALLSFQLFKSSPGEKNSIILPLHHRGEPEMFQWPYKITKCSKTNMVCSLCWVSWWIC